MFSVSNVLDEKASEVEQSGGASAKLPGRRRPPHWTERGPVNEVIFGQLRVFVFYFLFLRSVYGWMGIDVSVNVFLLEYLLNTFTNVFS